MTGGVGRVHVRCTASDDDAPRALALRDRLVRTARVHLPDALEQALASGRPERRVFAERVAVELDFDPGDYDDVTTALLWAGRVRRALETADDPAAAADGVVVFEDEREFFGAAAVEYATTGALSWVFGELACGAGSPAAGDFLAAFDSRARVAALAAALDRRADAAPGLWLRLSPHERRSAVEALAGLRAWGDWGGAAAAARRATDAGPDGPERGPAAAGAPAGSPRSGSRPGPRGTRAGASRDAGADATAQAAGEPSLEEWLAALARCARTGAADVRHAGGPTAAPAPDARGGESASRAGRRRAALPTADAAAAAAAPGETGLDERDAGAEADEGAAVAETWWSRVGGLVLLYPWLADLLAVDVAPGRELAYRSCALAAVAAEEPDEALLADPLVRLLAGDDPALPHRPLLRPPEAEGLTAAAEGVLASFAACLPGFERSSPGYLRRFLLERGALLARLEDGFAVRLEPAPLDPALVHLPYPLGPFRFAWSETVEVELRRA